MLCSLPFLVSKRCPPSNSDYKEDYGRPVSNRWGSTPARTATVHAHKWRPLPRNAELSANGVVRCVPGRARRSTAAAWVLMAWCSAIARMRITSPGPGGQKLAPGSGAPTCITHSACSTVAWSNNMASFSVGQCVVLQFTPDPWSVRITIAWCACTPPWSTKTCRGKFRVWTCSCLKIAGLKKKKKKKKKMMMTKIVKSVESGNSRGELAAGNSQLGLCIGR